MTITLEVAPELENRIKEAAAQVGLSLDAFILESVSRQLQPMQQRSGRIERLSKHEATLLQEINGSMAQMDWPRYRALIRKRQTETLTPSEQTELIALSDSLEAANAGRIDSLARLAALRKTTVPDLMQQLGLGPATCA
jgi:hypothetical protein